MDRQVLTREQIEEIFDIIGEFDIFVFKKTYDPSYQYKRELATNYLCSRWNLKDGYIDFYDRNRKRITSKEQLTKLFDDEDKSDIPFSYTIVIPMLECDYDTTQREEYHCISDYCDYTTTTKFTNTKPLGILPSRKIAKLFCLCGGFWVGCNNSPYTAANWNYIDSKEQLQKMIFTYNNNEIVVSKIRTIVLGSLANIVRFFDFCMRERENKDTKIFDDILKFANDNNWTNEILNYIKEYERDRYDELENFDCDDEAKTNKPICANEEYKLYEHHLFTDEAHQRKSLLKIVDIICGNNAGASFAIFTNIAAEKSGRFEGFEYPHYALIEYRDDLEIFLDDLKKWQEQQKYKHKLYIYSILVRGEMLSREQTLSLFHHQKYLWILLKGSEDRNPFGPTEWLWLKIYKEGVSDYDDNCIFGYEYLLAAINNDVIGYVCLGNIPYNAMLKDILYE